MFGFYQRQASLPTYPTAVTADPSVCAFAGSSLMMAGAQDAKFPLMIRTSHAVSTLLKDRAIRQSAGHRREPACQRLSGRAAEVISSYRSRSLATPCRRGKDLKVRAVLFARADILNFSPIARLD